MSHAEALARSAAGSDAVFLVGGGEMGALMRAHDWSATPLGPPSAWPQSLRAALSICLHSSFPTAIYWGPELRLLYNDAWAPIPADRHPWALGRPAEEVWGDIWPVVGPQFERVLATGEGFSTYDQMLPMVRGGAACETFWNYSFTPIHGEDGRVVGVFNQGHETTDRIFAERRRDAETERLRRMFEQAPSFMAMLRGPEHVFELTNAAYLQLIGHRNVIGRPARAALPEVEGQGFFELLDEVYATGEPFVGTAVPVDLQRTPDGAIERRFVDLVYQPVTDAAGDVTGIFVEGSDVTERVRVEAELRESEERFRELVERAPEKMWVNGPDGAVSYFNAAWRDYTGQPVVPDGLSWVGSIHPDDRAKITERRRQGVAAGEGYEVEVRIRRECDGAWRWHIGRVAPVRRDGTIFAWVGMAADIDEARRAQEQMRDLNATLENRVAERTAELGAAHDQLRQSQKMEAIGQLTGGLAHDLNNMLTIVTGNMDMARRSLTAGDEVRAHRAIANAMKGAESAGALTRRLLAFARRQPLAPKKVDAGELIDSMSELLARALGERVALRVVGASGLWPIHADPHQLENAVLNLAVNAKDAMPGGGTLAITVANARIEGREAAELELAPGPYVTVSVVDTGAGMPADVVARAFEPFYTTKAQGKGTGLGLSMVYGFAKQSGGSVAIDSRPGDGTTVRLHFPALVGGSADAVATDGGATAERRGVGTILLVEDQEDVADLAESILVDAGYGVRRAASGEEALRRLDEAPDVDLIFSDVVMPGTVSGVTLAIEARRRRPGMKILLTSGYSPDSSARGDAFPMLNKPYRRGDLLSRIREVLDMDVAS